MTPQRLLRSFARLLPLFLLSLALPHSVLGQSAVPGPSEMAPAARARLAQAAEDTLLAPWQRDLMQRLARTGTTSTLDSSAADLRAAGTPVWTQLTPSGTPPRTRGGQSAIYDPARNRMVVFGGDQGSSSSSFNDVWALSLADAPAWTQLTPSGTPPNVQGGQSAIYDSVRDRMVVFGGLSGLYYCNDVWALSLAGTPAWTKLTPLGTLPSGRWEHSAIYDPVRDRMVVFGGHDDAGYVNNVWVLWLAGTPAWTQLTPSGTPPSARSSHSAIYDPVRDRMVIFGGYVNSYSSFRDVWALSLAGTPAWTPLASSGTRPSSRYWHSSIYDPVRDRMVVFGGDEGWGSYLNDVWVLSLAGTPAWTQPTPSGTPPGVRERHSAIYDPVHDRMVVFGGGPSWPYLNDVWALEWSFNTAVDDPQAPPLISGLRPPAPNPTHGSTSVSFALAQAGHVQLGVYDVSGRLVRRLVDGERRAGTETLVWNGTNDSGARQAAGIYFVRLATPGFRETRRVILLR
jgi:hypothetical protein